MMRDIDDISDSSPGGGGCGRSIGGRGGCDSSIIPALSRIQIKSSGVR
jgi:hypothetical protein